MIVSIKSTDSVKQIPYYELGSYCQNEVNRLLSNKDIYEIFTKFAANYTYFEPYYDFLKYKLDYDFQIDDECLNDSKLISLSDITLQYQKYDFHKYIDNECFIDKDGNMLCLNKYDNKLVRHNDLACNIINMLIMQDKKNYLHYLKNYLEKYNNYDFYAKYLSCYLNYLRLAIIKTTPGEKEVILFYNSDYISDLQKDIIGDLKSKKLLNNLFDNDYAILSNK